MEEELQVLNQEIQEVLVVELVVEVRVVVELLVKETMEVILQAQMKELAEVETLVESAAVMAVMAVMVNRGP